MTAELTVRTIPTIRSVSPADWDRLADPGPSSAEPAPGCGDASTSPYNPFLDYAFLSALEDSGCVGGRTGWSVNHVVLEDAGGRLLGAVPAYLKSHSMGEYVFDHAWADAFERAGGRYYPKLQVSVPFTPATGPRLLAPDLATRGLLVQALEAVTRQLGLSSAHVTFAGDADAAALQDRGWLLRLDQQFHWLNRGYSSYEDFLGDLASRKRKALRRERREAQAPGITIEWVTGSDLTEAHWDAFYAFYMDTGSRKWGRPYLNRRFFSLVSERMADRILLVMAKRAGRWIAGALNFIGSDRLYGRNWGCIEEHPFLHFEVCYHQAIDFAIDRKLAVVEAGAQGEHKLARGYLPVTTRSLHFIPDPNFRRAIDHYLVRERAAVEMTGEALADAGPFRKVDVIEQD